MEINGYSPFEQSYLINELSQGMKVARQLRAQMGPEYSAETKEILLQQIVSSYEKALFILGCGESPEHPHQHLSVPSTRSNGHQDGKECSLMRKAASTWTEQVKVIPENGLDVLPDDGYNWRKYGQKDILGAKHPRSYYRCTYRSVQDCWATKQVQRSNDDPTVFDITYRGKHKCSVVRSSKSAPTSPGNQEPKQEDHPTVEYQKDSAMDLSFHTALPPNNGDMQRIESFPSTALGCLKGENLNNSFYGNIQNQRHHNLETNIADIISTNSPTVEPDLSLDSWRFNPNFPFNNPRLFP